MAIPTTCPHCQRAYALADHLQGRKVLCKQCNQIFRVEAASPAQDEEIMDVELVEEESPRNEGIQHEARSHQRAAAREQEERERPRRRSREETALRRPRRNNQGLVVGLVLGGLGLVLVIAGGVGAVWWFGRFRDQATGLGNVTVPTLGDLVGPWPTPGPLFSPRGAWPAEQTVTLHVSGVVDRNTRQAIEDKLGSLVDPGAGSASSSDLAGDRLSVLLAPVRDPHAFAQKVDFGAVLGVNGRVVTIVARKVDGPPPNADPVTQALFDLKSTNSHRRTQAARKLAEMIPDNRRADVARALEPLLNDPEFPTRDAVNKALGVWGSKENVPALLQALNHEHTRGSAIQALGRLKDERAVEPLAQLLENFFARHPASEALRAMGPMAEKAVIKRLHHHDGGVRGEAITILKVIGTRESLPALRAVVNEKDFFLTRQAEEAIRAIEARP